MSRAIAGLLSLIEEVEVVVTSCGDHDPTTISPTLSIKN
jgi:hypothetical protein